MKNGMPLDSEKGYSVYYFGQSNPSEYCVIDQEHIYAQQRFYMNLGAILVIVSIMFAVPLLLIAVYDNFRAEAKKDQNMRSFVWSIITVSAVSAGVMLVYDSFTVKYNIHLYPSNTTDIDFMTYTCTLSCLLLSLEQCFWGT